MAGEVEIGAGYVFRDGTVYNSEGESQTGRIVSGAVSTTFSSSFSIAQGLIDAPVGGQPGTVVKAAGVIISFGGGLASESSDGTLTEKDLVTIGASAVGGVVAIVAAPLVGTGFTAGLVATGIGWGVSAGIGAAYDHLSKPIVDTPAYTKVSYTDKDGNIVTERASVIRQTWIDNGVNKERGVVVQYHNSDFPGRPQTIELYPDQVQPFFDDLLSRRDQPPGEFDNSDYGNSLVGPHTRALTNSLALSRKILPTVDLATKAVRQITSEREEVAGLDPRGLNQWGVNRDDGGSGGATARDGFRQGDGLGGTTRTNTSDDTYGGHYATTTNTGNATQGIGFSGGGGSRFQTAAQASYASSGHRVSGTATSNNSIAATDEDDPRVSPVLLDLNRDGHTVTVLSRSTHFVDASDDGLENRVAWAGAGDGVLFYDEDGSNSLNQTKEFVFTEWDPTAPSDLEALASVFDSNGDGKLTDADDDFGAFRVLVTNADGSTEVKSLADAEVNIAEIDLTGNATRIELPDGSVITGQTSFTDGQGVVHATGVADVELAADGRSYRVEESETVDGDGTRTLVQQGFDREGALAFEVTSVTSADGTHVTISYDDDGDRVVDRVQEIVATAVNGETVETETHYQGASIASAALVSRIVRTTSADGDTLTIERDATGGGWFTQRETREKLADDSVKVTVEDLAHDGSVIASVTKTPSGNGLTRVEQHDLDGNGGADLVRTHTITIDPATGDRTETVTETNFNGSLRTRTTEEISADARQRTVKRDLDGDGTAVVDGTDVREETVIAVTADGSTVSTLEISNKDKSFRSKTVVSQSSDALVRTTESFVDDSAEFDRKRVEETSYDAGSRIDIVQEFSADDSLLAATKVELAANQIETTSWVDGDLDGVFQLRERVAAVTVDGATGDRSETQWVRAFDGTILSRTVTVTDTTGLESNISVDSDGDGDFDNLITDTTVENPDGSTRTVVTANNDGTERSSVTTTTTLPTAANDVFETLTEHDLDGDPGFEKVVRTKLSTAADGAVTRDIREYAGDGTTLLEHVQTIESPDRRTIVTNVDTDGNGGFDRVTVRETQADGQVAVTETRYAPDGSVISSTVRTTSANALEVTTETDVDGVVDENGNTSYEQKTASVTVLQDGGGRYTTMTEFNPDGTAKSSESFWVRDDGFVSTNRQNRRHDQDNVFETKSETATVLNDDGSVTETTSLTSPNANAEILHSKRAKTTSGDGLTVTIDLDRNGDEAPDLVTEAITVLNDDGGSTKTTDVTDVSGETADLRSRMVETVSGTGRLTTVKLDLDGDGDFDRVETTTLADDGSMSVGIIDYADNGKVWSRTLTETSGTGLVTEQAADFDADGVYEAVTVSTTTLGADGGRTTVSQNKAADGSVLTKTVSFISDDGFFTSESHFLDAGNTADRVIETGVSIANDGIRTTTESVKSDGGALISERQTILDRTARKETVNFDADGLDGWESVSVTQTLLDGTISQVQGFFDSVGSAMATHTVLTGATGLSRSETWDLDGDGADEYTLRDVTTFAPNGQVETVRTAETAPTVTAAERVHKSQYDGLWQEETLDYDGDGTHELTTTDNTITDVAGETTRTVSVSEFDGAADTEISSIQYLTSGNGFVRTETIDLNADDHNDLVVSVTEAAQGGYTKVTSQYGLPEDVEGTPIAPLLRQVTEVESADGLTLTVASDLDGDGATDRHLERQIGSDRSVRTTFEDRGDTGVAAEARIISDVAFNGTLSETSIDVDADGQADINRRVETRVDNSGTTISTFSEIHGNRISFRETRSESGDGLNYTRETDLNGDGTVDKIGRTETVLNADGSTSSETLVHYHDDELHYRATVETSRDGRTTTLTRDMDGDGVSDMQVVEHTRIDGTQVTTETGFDPDGNAATTNTTTVSADGLVVTVEKAETGEDTVVETTTYSHLGNGTYVWDNGLDGSEETPHVTATHTFDLSGLQTWDLVTSDGPTTYSARLDARSYQNILDDAARLYDTVFDRGMERAEREMLVKFVTNGVLDREALATELLASEEFSTRYETRDSDGNYVDLSDLAFVERLYLNSFGRAPGLGELQKLVPQLDDASLTREALAIRLAVSSEHHVVGNGHLSSNNWDAELTPTKFERTLDRSLAEAQLINLFQVILGRDASYDELRTLGDRLMTGTESVADIADEMIAENALYPEAQPWRDVSGELFVAEAIRNTLQRWAATEEKTFWGGLLTSSPEDLTKGQFLAALSQSHEYLAVRPSDFRHILTMDGTGSANVALDAAALDGVIGDTRDNQLDAYGHTRSVEIMGGDGADTINGGANADTLHGDAGADHILGNGGNDVLFVDAADFGGSGSVNGNGGIDTIVVLGDVGVSVDLPSHNLEIVYGSAGDDSLDAAGSSLGLKIYGRAGSDTVLGSAGNDELSGGDGDDTLDGGSADDVIFGGSGLDDIDGGNGDDLILAGAFSDSILGGNGDDNILAGSGNDTVRGDRHDDRINGGAGDDSLDGGYGDDVLHGDIGNDTLSFWLGDDTLHGGRGDDSFYLKWDAINYGNDAFVSHWTRAVIYGGTGEDVLYLDDDESFQRVEVRPGQWQLFQKQSNGAKFGIDLVDIEKIVNGSGQDITPTGGISLGVEADTTSDYVRANAVIGIHFGDVNGFETAYGLHEGWTGEDTILGWVNNDYVQGGYGADELWGYLGNDTLTGSTGSDALLGEDGDDSLLGGSGSDFISGGDGQDTVVASEGSDIVWGGAGDDSIEGNSGNDSLHGYLVDETDDGSSDGNDSLWGHSGHDVLYGYGGTDLLYGGSGLDWLNGGQDGDTLDGGEGADELFGEDGDDSLIGGNGEDYLDGGSGNDALDGGDQDDWLRGGDGDDTLLGGGAADFLIGGSGADVLDGGAGVLDSASYQGSADGVAVNLAEGTASGGDAEGDTISGVENLYGSAENDTLTGNHQNNILAGGAGADSLVGAGGHDDIDGGGQNDTIDAGAGNDRVWGGLGNDTVDLGDGDDVFFDEAQSDNYGQDSVDAGAGNDTLFGAGGHDTLIGGEGDDWLQGGSGADSLTGGAGFDTVSYGSAMQAIVVSMLGTANSSGDAAGDILDGIEKIVGSNFGDAISADHLGRALEGVGGDDTLIGGDGNDTLDGGDGADLFQGGLGVDIVTYASATAGVTLDLETALNSTGDAAGDAYENIEVLQGSSFGDLLHGGGQIALTLDGGLGDDTLSDAGANASFDGGEGIDLVNFLPSVEAVTVNLSIGNAKYGESGPDVSIVNVENVTGSVGADTIIGDDGANELRGHDGYDAITALGGDDIVYGGNGKDVIDLGDGNDIFWDTAQDNTLGDDSVDGGAGRDTLNGDGGNDTLNGDGWKDTILGGAGNDVLNGGADDDLLVGGSGDDLLTGGAGSDVFEFNATDGSSDDIITDFALEQDRLRIETALWGGALDQTRLDALSDLSSGTLVLRFDDSNSLALNGLTSNAALLSDIELV